MNLRVFYCTGMCFHTCDYRYQIKLINVPHISDYEGIRECFGKPPSTNI